MFKKAITNRGTNRTPKKDKVGSKCYDTWANYIADQKMAKMPKSRARGVCSINGKFAILSNNKYSPKPAGTNRAEIRRAAKSN